MHAIRLADRDIFAEAKALVAEMISGFIGGCPCHVVVESPAVARSVHKVAEFIVLVGPLTNDTAGLAMGFSSLDIDPRRRV